MVSLRYNINFPLQIQWEQFFEKLSNMAQSFEYFHDGALDKPRYIYGFHKT